ncbi:MAG: tetratricopeptide repeat protein [Myxococcota bacterium]|nr:tetratricopeptide repeat protein [Myxococcota bacterium]
MNDRLLAVIGIAACAACHPRGIERAVAATVQPTSTNPLGIARMAQGVKAARDGQPERAVSLLREAIGLNGSLWEARYDLGILLADAGDLAGAEGELGSAAQMGTDSQDVALALAEVRQRRGEAKLAADGLTDFVTKHPHAIEAKTLYVAALRESGQLDKAVAEARELLIRRPADPTASAELALCHLARGEKTAAGLLAKQALESNPNSAVAHRVMGLLDLANGDDAEAFVEFRKAAQSDPQDTTSRLNMGVVLLHAGAYTRAEEQYREILVVSPEDVEAQVGLAAALRGAGDPQHSQRFGEARVILERVLATHPHETRALFNLGVLEADFLKRPAAAAAYFKRFLADAPSDHPLRAEAERYVSAAGASATLTQPPAAPAIAAKK